MSGLGTMFERDAMLADRIRLIRRAEAPDSDLAVACEFVLRHSRDAFEQGMARELLNALVVVA